MKKIDLTEKQLKKYVDIEFEVKNIDGEVKTVNVSLTIKDVADIIMKMQEADTLDIVGTIREVLNIGDEFDDATVLLMVEAVGNEVEKLDKIPRETFAGALSASNLRR